MRVGLLNGGRPDAGRFAARALLAAGLVASAAATWRAVRLDPVSPVEPASVTLTPQPTRPPPYPPERLLAAALRDPFRPDRTASPFGSSTSGPSAEDDALAGVPDGPGIRLTGTALAPGGGVVVCEAMGSPAELVRIGETCAGHTLREVRRKEAIFTTGRGERLVVSIAGAPR